MVGGAGVSCLGCRMARVIFISRLIGVVAGIGFAGAGLLDELSGRDSLPMAILALLAVVLGALPWAVSSKN